MEDSSKVKGKRTKRQRLQLSSMAAGPSSSFSLEFSESATDEEEDMANCLILLAQGGHMPEPIVTEEPTTAMKATSRRFAEAATTTGGKAGVYAYECKTCGKCFSTFQALGGHRASHKKPKLSIPPATADETKTAMMTEDSILLSMNTFSLPVAAKARLHECSICGAVFNTGQALGGHMRRHRPANLQEPAKKKEKPNRLFLDLNLPAPAEDDNDLAKSSSPVSATKTPAFSLSSKTPILLLTSSLVNCHY